MPTKHSLRAHAPSPLLFEFWGVSATTNSGKVPKTSYHNNDNNSHDRHGCDETATAEKADERYLLYSPKGGSQKCGDRYGNQIDIRQNIAGKCDSNQNR